MVRSLVPWTEWSRPLWDFRREMDSLFERFFSETPELPAPRAFVPRTDIAETDDAYEIMVEIPGVKPEDFNIELKNGELWITGEKKEEHEREGRTWHQVERFYGQFRRVIPLTMPVEQDRVQAEYTHGVLKVTVPKAASAKPKHITVKAGSDGTGSA
jgi:HSP20 family protein